MQIKSIPQEEAALKNVRVVNPEAYEFYLKKRYFFDKRMADGLKIALAYFNQAIEEDPKYAQAYSGLAATYALLAGWQYGVMAPKEAFPKAKAAAIKSSGVGRCSKRRLHLARILPRSFRLELGSCREKIQASH